MERLKGIFKIGIIVVLILSLVAAFPANSKAQGKTGNEYPLVFVHGLAGWGPDEALGIKYWGGFNDLQKYMNNQGYNMLTATVGPVSSNWDRSVELYYYIKGGTVDYGAAHAAEHGHSRYGRTFKGIYPEWDGEHPIHLIGHSMGGLTVRALTDLLEDGDKKEQAYYKANPNSGISPLFEGGKKWIHSVTTLATPNDGTTFADNESAMAGLIKELVLNVANVAGINPNYLVYDFKLEHWGIKRLPGESFTSYLNKAMKSKIWESDDISIVDLGTKGAAENNKWIDTHSDVYYFSYSSQSSYKSLIKGYHLPNLVKTTPLFLQPSTFMGKFTRNTTTNGPKIDSTWWPNDGMVNTRSSLYPSGQPAIAFNGKTTPNPGIWNYYPVLTNWDHMTYMGLFPSVYGTSTAINNFYTTMAKSLYALPAKK